jgi:hypothetical protein
MVKFTYGFATKKIHGKEYVYFWKYTGTGCKNEQYIGRVGKAETEKTRKDSNSCLRKLRSRW